MIESLELIISTSDSKVENRYTIKSPTVVQAIQIENKKNKLAEGDYSGLILNNTVRAYKILDLIDCFAYFSVLCPELFRDMKVDETKLTEYDASRVLVKAYKEQFVPWFMEYERILDLPIDEVIEEKKEI